jgi:hypothetical protein
MKRIRVILLVAAVLSLMLATTAALAERHEEPFDRTLSFDAGDRLVVDNENGSVTVESWDRNQVRIQATKYADRGSRESAMAALAEIRIEVVETAGGVEVRTVTPRRSDSSGFWGWMKGDSGNYGVTYTITVPRSANLDVETINGRVVVREISGEMELESTNGRIEVHDGAGRVDASTTNGRIYAQLRSVAPGGMRFSTTNGSVEVELPGTVAANLDVSTTNGSIKTDFPITVSGSFSKNRISGEMNGGGEQIRIRTTNGSVRINKVNG